MNHLGRMNELVRLRVRFPEASSVGGLKMRAGRTRYEGARQYEGGSWYMRHGVVVRSFDRDGERLLRGVPSVLACCVVFFQLGCCDRRNGNTSSLAE